MTGDLVSRFQVGLQNRFLDVAPALVPAGVHVDRDQSFSLVNYDIAAALEPHLAMKGVVNLLLYPERLEDGRTPIIIMQTIARTTRNIADERAHPLHGAAIVANHFVNFLRQKIAHRSLD